MAKKKIELRKPNYVVAKQSAAISLGAPRVTTPLPAFFRLLLAATYLLSALAILFAYQWINPDFQPLSYVQQLLNKR